MVLFMTEHLKSEKGGETSTGGWSFTSVLPVYIDALAGVLIPTRLSECPGKSVNFAQWSLPESEVRLRLRRIHDGVAVLTCRCAPSPTRIRDQPTGRPAKPEL